MAVSSHPRCRISPFILLAFATAGASCVAFPDPSYGRAVIPVPQESANGGVLGDAALRFVSVGVRGKESAGLSANAAFVAGSPVPALLDVPPGSYAGLVVRFYRADAKGLPIESEEAAHGAGRPFVVAPDTGSIEVPLFLAHTGTWATPLPASNGQTPTSLQHIGGAATLLADGQIALVGGATFSKLQWPPAPADITDMSKNVEYFDTTTHALSGATSIVLSKGRAFHAAVPFQDDKGSVGVAVVGGFVKEAEGLVPTDTAEVVYADGKPASPVSPLEFARARFSTVAIPDVGSASMGRYFLCGGEGEGLSTCELWGPNEISTFRNLDAPRRSHGAAFVPGLAKPTVVVCGGENAAGVVKTCEVFTIDGKSVTTTQVPVQMPGPARLDPIVAGVNGRAIVLGGFEDLDRSKPLARADVLDLTTASFTWTPLGDKVLSTARGAASLHAFGEGEIWVAGGIAATGPSKAVDLIEVSAKGAITVTVGPSLASPRLLGVFAPLPSGFALLAGGAREVGGNVKANHDVLLGSPKGPLP